MFVEGWKVRRFYLTVDFDEAVKIKGMKIKEERYCGLKQGRASTGKRHEYGIVRYLVP